MLRTYLLSLALLSMVACGTSEDQQTDSDLHYITFGRGVSGLIAKVKQQKLRACLSGHGSADRDIWVKNIEAVVLKWVEPLRHLSADQLTTSVEVVDGRGNCDTDIVIAPNTHSNTSIGKYPTVRMSPSGYFSGFNVLLHEFGHAFALSDTYQNGASGNCKPGQPQAVMCNTSFNSLQVDDVKGVEEIFRRTFPNDRPSSGSVLPPDRLDLNFSLALGSEASAGRFEIFAGVSGLDATESLIPTYCLSACEQTSSWKKMKFVQSKPGSFLFSAGLQTIVDAMSIQIQAEEGSSHKISKFGFKANT